MNLIAVGVTYTVGFTLTDTPFVLLVLSFRPQHCSISARSVVNTLAMSHVEQRGSGGSGTQTVKCMHAVLLKS
jgi:hypothetical protein